MFKSEPESPQDDDKLLDLFKNRAELKKEFAALRKEKFVLQDRVKHHEGATARVQQQLEHLESLLLDPEWVHNVAVFYQLRRLGAHCRARLERFAEELKQQREKRIRDKSMSTWNAERERDTARIQRRLHKLRLHQQTMENQLLAARRTLEEMSGVAKMLSGKPQAAAIAELEQALEVARAKEQRLLGELASIDEREPPAVEGLDIATKRSINLMVLSFVQLLYLQYREDDLARLAKEAGEKSVGAVRYGSKRDCDQLLCQISRSRKEADLAGEFADALKNRAARIADDAHYRNADDTVPVSASVSTVYDIDANGVVFKSDANLLGENYFGVTTILSR
jgi:hypothetical protein